MHLLQGFLEVIQKLYDSLFGEMVLPGNTT